MENEWECVVVGGGAAGLSAALVLGRARRRTLVVDAGEQSNRAAAAVGGLLGHDHQLPADLYATGRRELAAYPTVEYRQDVVASGAPDDGGYTLELAGGDTVRARRVLLATGMRYCPPELPGLSELWGTSVFQCPFCHGWEMRDLPLAALATGDEGVHAALMLRGWSDDVVLLTDGPSGLDPEHVDLLTSAKVVVDERRITGLIGENGQLSAVAFADGDRMPRQGLLVEAPLQQRSSLAEQLGAAGSAGPMSADAIGVDPLHRTNVPTVFAAGDNCTEQPSVAGAMAAGSQAAMIIVQSLLADEFGLPYPPE
ncbi:NAD(P)/FAD-dependent oxidoreductase [Mycolicibacterium mengxianglii]|uniref:NAD(P)/FAD-dependent oxidoreductase n=1 Tax=Mycolicibacterium mengxianglii TaxID=2736649 RepID=UPI0018EEE3A0|nr:NAD(P)/FAD-dependent oxidoreductase [Mycolicibacterium mengxianglii]